MSRSYQSIGDVLSLLRSDFPDITISKIRFLESQGLVSPQRSPSGYRKFYDEDVERLRYVLAQQRDHFLPLKVIRDRLNGVTSDEDSGAGDPPPEIAATPAAPTGAKRGPTAVGPDVAASRSATGPSASPTPVGASTGPTIDDPLGTPQNREPTVADVLAALQEVPAVRQRAVAAAAAKTPRHASRSVVGVTMTTAELCAETGLDEYEIVGLVEFGILRQRSVAGLSVFDEHNVEIAKAATGMLALGIEPRHLKQFRNAAEREMGLLEQMLTPMLRQRNPEASEKAAQLADDLVAHGDQLRSAILAAEVNAFLNR